MNRVSLALAGLCGAVLTLSAHPAERTLIRNATVHTVGPGGTLERTDVLIEDGKIAALGSGLAAADAAVIDAKGRPVTPGFFGGIGYLGLQEIGFEPSAEDYALRLDAMRPEFDVAPAFNPDSVAIVVNRIDGVTFAAISPASLSGRRGEGPRGSIVAGQAAVVALDGLGPLAPRALVIDLGGDTSSLAGGSRAGNFMLLRQAFLETRAPGLVLAQDDRLLTPAGRQVMLEYLKGAGPFLFEVDRAADIRETLAFMKREGIPRAVIVGGAEAWRVARELAAAKVAVVLDPLENLPAGFDSVGATLENAARLHAAGVRIAFSFADPEPHNIRKLRQAAGNAVAHGLPYAAALAALTRVPAELFGVADRFGSIASGRPADLVLWSGDPFEVTTVAERVFVAGRDQPMRSRQTDLRDRYLERVRAHSAR